MAELWLICEGKSDADILNKILMGVLAADIIPKACGGGSNAGSAAAYLSHNDSNVTAAYVIDRDYRRRADADATYTDGKRRFIWRRHAIESYLLEPAIIVEALRTLKASMASVPSGGPKWVKQLPDVEVIIADGLRTCAGLRAPQEAGRIAMQRLWEDLSDTAGQIQMRMSGALMAGSPAASVCRQEFLDEVTRLVAKAGETAASTVLTPTAAGQRYDAELARVTAADYVHDLRFVEEFNGKDLLVVFLEWLATEHGSRLRPDRLRQELERAAPIVYRSNRSIYGTDDFLDLANGVLALAGLAPVT